VTTPSNDLIQPHWQKEIDITDFWFFDDATSQIQETPI
jgi:hypothetical protein